MLVFPFSAEMMAARFEVIGGVTDGSVEEIIALTEVANLIQLSPSLGPSPSSSAHSDLSINLAALVLCDDDDEGALLFNIPACSVIGHRSSHLISFYLNPPRMMGNDWKGLADYMRFSHLEIENFALCPDPMREVLKHWCSAGGERSTIGALLGMIKDLEREDLLLALKPPLGKFYIVM